MKLVMQVPNWIIGIESCHLVTSMVIEMLAHTQVHPEMLELG